MEFFNSLRSQPYRRTEDRIVGGVCAGIAHHFGIAPLVVRFVFVLAVFASSWTLAAYAIAWVLVPEHRDGRIHAQELIQGRPNAALAGALIVFLFATRNTGILSFGIGTRLLDGNLIAVAVLVVIAGGVIALILRSRSTPNAPPSASHPHFPAGQQPPAAQPGAPVGDRPTAPMDISDAPLAANAMADQPAASNLAAAQRPQASERRQADDGEPLHPASPQSQTEQIPTGQPLAGTPGVDSAQSGYASPSGPATASLAPASATWQHQSAAMAPRKVKTPAVSARFIAITIAMALAAAALTSLAMGHTFGSMLTAAGVSVAIVGIALVIAAFRGLRGTWLTACSWLLVVPLVGATTIAVYTPNAVLTDPAASVLTMNPTGKGDSVTALIGAGHVDVEQDIATNMHTAFAGWVFSIPDNANYRFVISGLGSVSVMDYGGWKVLEDGKQAVSEPRVWEAYCWQEPADDWDEESGEMKMIEKCTPEIESNYHEYLLNGRSSLVNAGSSLEVLTPAAVKDPDRAREVHLEFGVGSVQFNSSTQPPKPTDSPNPGEHPRPTPSSSPSSKEEQ